jgi:hypothetical protein
MNNYRSCGGGRVYLQAEPRYQVVPSNPLGYAWISVMDTQPSPHQTVATFFAHLPFAMEEAVRFCARINEQEERNIAWGVSPAPPDHDPEPPCSRVIRMPD